MKEFKGTDANYQVVEYAGWYHIQTGEYYGDPDLLNEDDFKEAPYNAQLMATSLDLLKAAEYALLELQLLPCKCDPKAISKLEQAINKALGDEK